MQSKIAVIGGGNVGATAAQRAAERELGDVVLLDIIDGIPQGKGLDMFESAAIERFNGRVTGTTCYDDIAGSDIVIITAGLARKPGMTREDLLLKNGEIIAGICREVARVAPDSIIIMVTNPLDIMTQLAIRVTGFDRSRVIGMAGILDSARMCAFIAMELDVAPSDIDAMVLGGHGDSMVPLPRYTTISGIPITELLSAGRIEAINERTRKGGAEIVSLLKTGSAYYAPSAGAVEMAESIIRNQKKIIPSSVLLNGEYGLSDVCIGVPVKLGSKGAIGVIELNLSDEELNALQDSARIVSDNVSKLMHLWS